MDISQLVSQLSDELDDDACMASDILAEHGSEQVVDEMIKLLDHPEDEPKIMAARTLGLIEKNQRGLEPLLANIDSHTSIAGDLLVSLEGFDLSTKYVVVFKYYLFGSFKVSSIAKYLLDTKTFDIVPRTLKKALKAWNHYENNVKHDEVFELRKQEVFILLNDLESRVIA